MKYTWTNFMLGVIVILLVLLVILVYTRSGEGRYSSAIGGLVVIDTKTGVCYSIIGDTWRVSDFVNGSVIEKKVKSTGATGTDSVRDREFLEFLIKKREEERKDSRKD